MSKIPYPAIDIASMADTKNALHAYARLMGTWLKHCRAKRKHWWHTSLRPSLKGLTTGMVYGAIDFEIELNMRESFFNVSKSTGQQLNEPLQGESVAQLQDKIKNFLVSCGLGEQSIPELPADIADAHYADYSPAQAKQLADVLSSVTAVMTNLRTGIREETSPIQLWPHHFDLSMLWLPGEKVPDQDPDNEEYADNNVACWYNMVQRRISWRSSSLQNAD